MKSNVTPYKGPTCLITYNVRKERGANVKAKQRSWRYARIYSMYLTVYSVFTIPQYKQMGCIMLINAYIARIQQIQTIFATNCSQFKELTSYRSWWTYYKCKCINNWLIVIVCMQQKIIKLCQNFHIQNT